MRRIVLVSSLVLLGAQARAQTSADAIFGVPQAQKPTVPYSRQAIERHLESAHPITRPNLHGAVPGTQLVVTHDARVAALARRMQQIGVPTPLAEDANGTIMPGLEMRPALPAGSYPTAVVTGDFNRDGHEDFVVANGKSNDLWIYFGEGDGTFELPHIVPLTKGETPVFLVAADLRGNGILDLVVAEFGSSTIGVLLGKGDGTFELEQQYVLPEPPAALTVADFQHHGKPDIAAVMVTYNESNLGKPGPPYIAMLRGNGDGAFASPVITYNWGFYADPFDLDAADVNGDGLPDLLITGPGTDNSTIYLNNGDGTFKEGPLVVGNGDFNTVVSGRLVDINGDGCPDAVVADIVNDVWIRFGDCAGGFGTRPLTGIPMGQANMAVRVADVNGDGHPDLIASSVVAEEPNYLYSAGNTISVALGDGKGNFGLPRIYGGSSEAESLAIGDFKGDGRPSIVTADIDTDTATVYPNDGKADFGFPQGIYSCRTNKDADVCPNLVTGFGSGYAFADLNGDRKPDIFQIGFSADIEPGNLTNYSYYSSSFLNDGSGRFGAPNASLFYSSTVYPVLTDYRLGDFRNTGHLDLVVVGSSTAGSTTNDLIVFQPGNGDGTFGGATVTSIAGANGPMAIGDFNGDGKLDFVTVNGSPHTLTTFLGNGNGTFRPGASLTFSDTNENIARVFVGDFNRDGKLDILVFATSDGYVTTGSTVWEFDGNGDGTFRPGRELFTDFQPITLADINNDGHPDIVRFDFSLPDGLPRPSPLIANYLGQADGTFRQVSSYSPYGEPPLYPEPLVQFGDPLSVSVTGDYSGGGKIDEVAFQVGTPIFAQILRGNGDGTFTPTYDVFPFAPHVYPENGHDLNDDRFTDMVSLDPGTGGMMIQRGAPAPALQIALIDPISKTTSGCGVVFPNLISSSSRSVSLSSSTRGVVLPASITLPARATHARFCFTLDKTFDAHQAFEITATMGGDSADVYGSKAYVPPFALSVTPAGTIQVYGGRDTEPLTVTVHSQSFYASGTVNFGCQGLPAGYSCEFHPAQATLGPASSASAKLVIHAAEGSPPLPTIAITADDGQTVQRVWLTINVATLSVYAGNPPPPVYATSPGKQTAEFSVSGIPPYTFSCSGLPAGSRCSFSGTQLTYPIPSQITASIAIPAGVAAQTSSFQVIVSSGGLTAIM